MCLILIARNVRTDAPLILAANRDEFHSRPTAPASVWPDSDGMVAGRDLLRGGTWLGVTRAGRFCAVTNVREPLRAGTAAERSRGELPVGFLRSDRRPEEWLRSLRETGDRYGGFNIAAGGIDGVWTASNRDPGNPRPVPDGIHGVSNAIPGQVWPKVSGGVTDLGRILSEGDLSPEKIFEVLGSEETVDDADLPDTGVGLDLERRLAPRFVRLQGYGTRASTVVLFGSDRHVTFMERTWPVRDGLPETRRFRFRFDGGQHRAS